MVTHESEDSDEEYITVDRGSLRGMMAFLFGVGFVIGGITTIIVAITIF